MRASVLAVTFSWSFAVVLSACGADDPTSYTAAAIKDQVPQGQMDGTPWTMVEPSVRVDSFDENSLSVSLFAQDVDECGFAPTGSGGEIIFSVPRMEGEYPLKLDFSSDSQTITFVPSPGNNIVAGEGLIVIDSMADGQISMGLIAKAGSSSINGKFTTPICAE
jgi:hypothetical protein